MEQLIKRRSMVDLRICSSSLMVSALFKINKIGRLQEEFRWFFGDIPEFVGSRSEGSFSCKKQVNVLCSRAN